MPHADNNNGVAVVIPAKGDMDNNTFAPLVNGSSSPSKPQTNSKVLTVRHPFQKPQHTLTHPQHLQSYPVVHDSVEYYKHHPMGAKSLSLLSRTYTTYIAPLHPYLRTPYSYLSPYITRADELGDTSLSKIDTTFPIVKEDTTKLRETVSGYALAPIMLAGQGKELAVHGKEYVLATWEDEYQKTAGDVGVVRSVKALVSTQLKIGIDGYGVVSGYLGRRGEQASDQPSDQGFEKVEKVKKNGF